MPVLLQLQLNGNDKMIIVVIFLLLMQKNSQKKVFEVSFYLSI